MKDVSGLMVWPGMMFLGEVGEIGEGRVGNDEGTGRKREWEWGTRQQ